MSEFLKACIEAQKDLKADDAINRNTNIDDNSSILGLLREIHEAQGIPFINRVPEDNSHLKCRTTKEINL